MNRYGENNGSSYLLFTICTAIVSAFIVLIDQQANTQGSHVVFAIAATLTYLVNLVGIIFLFWREWAGQAIEISLTERNLSFAGYSIPWRLYRTVDHYLGLNLSFALIMMTFWVWDTSADKDTYYSFPSSLNVQNPWAMWMSFIGTSFAIYNGVGFAEFAVISTATVAIATWHIILAKPIDLIVAAIVVSEGFESVQRKRRAQDAISKRHEDDDPTRAGVEPTPLL